MIKKSIHLSISCQISQVIFLQCRENYYMFLVFKEDDFKFLKNVEVTKTLLNSEIAKPRKSSRYPTICNDFLFWNFCGNYVIFQFYRHVGMFYMRTNIARFFLNEFCLWTSIWEITNEKCIFSIGFYGIESKWSQFIRIFSVWEAIIFSQNVKSWIFQSFFCFFHFVEQFNKICSLLEYKPSELFLKTTNISLVHITLLYFKSLLTSKMGKIMKLIWLTLFDH